MSDLKERLRTPMHVTIAACAPELCDYDVEREEAAARIEALEAEVVRLKDSEWQAKHTDTMNEIVSMGLARDEALARAEAAEANLAEALREIVRQFGDTPGGHMAAYIASRALATQEKKHG